MLLNQDLLATIKRIQFKANYLTTQALMGEYVSAFKGHGIEFEEVREYIEGDDIRFIDWNVTARTNKPFVRVYKEERELIIMLLIDVSRSMLFGSSLKPKNELAAEIGAILAFLAIKNNDKVGLIMFSEEVEKYIPPQKGRNHVWNIIKNILTHESVHTKTNIKKALEFLTSISKKKSSCFLISDFIDMDFEQSLKITSQKHHLSCIKLYDPKEFILNRVGYVDIEDLESASPIILNTYNKKFITNFYEQQIQLDKKFQDFLKINKIDYISCSVDDDIVKKLETLFNKK